jgi:uncharacterized membrane protein (UPF0136 family)
VAQKLQKMDQMVGLEVVLLAEHLVVLLVQEIPHQLLHRKVTMVQLMQLLLMVVVVEELVLQLLPMEMLVMEQHQVSPVLA